MGPLSVRARKNKRSKKGAKQVSSSIKSLPNDLLLEVVAKVASNSVDDLCRLRLSCMEFNKTGQDDYVYKNVSIDKFPIIPWRKKKRKQLSDFLRHCQERGNAEALFRQGMLDRFSSKSKEESGFELLKKAASKGHVEAMYVYGIVLLCLEGEKHAQQGLQVLSSLDGRDLRELREKIKVNFFERMWRNNSIVLEMVASNARTKICSECQNLQTNSVVKRGWDDLYDEDDNFNGCKSCKWNREVNIFCDMLGP